MGDTFGILVLVMLQKIPINTVYCINLSYAGLQNQEVWYKQDHQYHLLFMPCRLCCYFQLDHLDSLCLSIFVCGLYCFSSDTPVKLNLTWIICPYLCVNKLWRSHPLPLPTSASFAPKPQPKNSHECACCVYLGNRLEADIFSIHLLTACTFGPIEIAHLFVRGKKVSLSLSAVYFVWHSTSLIPVVKWDEKQLRWNEVCVYVCVYVWVSRRELAPQTDLPFHQISRTAPALLFSPFSHPPRPPKYL